MQSLLILYTVFLCCVKTVNRNVTSVMVKNDIAY